MTQTLEERNKALVLEAFDTLFNKRDYKAAEWFWSANYIQHSAHIPPGPEGLFGLIRSVPSTLRYEPGVILADKDSSGGHRQPDRPNAVATTEAVRHGPSPH